MKWLVAALLVAGCAKKQEAPPAPGVPQMSPAEIKRSEDACKAYVEQACACAEKVPAVKPTCDLAKALPDAIRMSLEVAGNSDSSRRDAISAQASVRKTTKECIEQLAKLPTLGCP